MIEDTPLLFPAELLILYDAANQALSLNAISNKLILVLVKETSKWNLIFMTCEDCTAAQIMHFYKIIIKMLVKLDGWVQDMKEDSSWRKVMVHTIGIEQFGGNDSIKSLRQEIEKFNVGIQ